MSLQRRYANAPEPRQEIPFPGDIFEFVSKVGPSPNRPNPNRLHLSTSSIYINMPIDPFANSVSYIEFEFGSSRFEDLKLFESIRLLLTEMESEGRFRSYYSVLGVAEDSDDDEIRRAYRKLAMRWHPDKWTRSPSLLSEAKLKFQQIQEAYSVLSDKRKRMLYDAGLYDPEDEYDEGFCDFLQEMKSLMADVRREEKTYSLEELQTMLVDMTKDFEYPEWSGFSDQSQLSPIQWGQNSLDYDGSGRSKRARCDTNPVGARTSHLHASSFGLYGNQFCH